MASKVNLFFPIALCNIFLKMITKIIANRLRPLLDRIIHPCQSAFIPDMSINDNVIINHEVMNYHKGKKGKKRYMAIMVDLAKAYDKVEWTILTRLLLKLGFESKFLAWLF